MSLKSYIINFHIVGEYDDSGNKVIRRVIQLGNNPADALQRFDNRIKKNGNNYEIIGPIEYGSGPEYYINKIRKMFGKEPEYV